MYPTLIRLGPLGIHTFGLMMALGFLAGLYAIRVELRRRGISAEVASRVIFWAIIGGLIGAKTYYLVGHGGRLRDVLSGSGLAWYGGLMGGTACVLAILYLDPRLQTRDLRGNITSRRMRDAVDAIGPAILLGQAFGRIGCLLSGDGDYGPPTDLPWGISFPHGTVPSVVDGVVIAVHPTMLYDVVLLATGFAILWNLRKPFERYPGALFGTSILLLGVERLTVEFWRLSRVFSFTSTPMGWESRSLAAHVQGRAWDGLLLVHGISEYQIWSLVAIVAGGILAGRALRGTASDLESRKRAEPRSD